MEASDIDLRSLTQTTVAYKNCAGIKKETKSDNERQIDTFMQHGFTSRGLDNSR